MQIEDVLLAPGKGAFFYDNQAAICVGLVLADGFAVWGDIISIQYSGPADAFLCSTPTNSQT
ncbi:hypothetical protein [Mesorhizobium sp.]|uniref:hypothetical protein n=1 Tax=Mesorhizobium sp. TaxID=1871066 RepID=UPI0026BEA0BF